MVGFLLGKVLVTWGTRRCTKFVAAVGAKHDHITLLFDSFS